MRILSVENQPNFNGKVIYKKNTSEKLTTFVPSPIWQKLKEVRDLVQDKPYDIFISPNKQDPNFYNVAANTTFEEAQKIKEYTVKVQANVFSESITDAVKEAMNMYEKYISKSIKG